MQLVVTEDDIGIWVQLEGDTTAEWDAPEGVAAHGERTSGPGPDPIPRLRELAGRLGASIRVIRR